MVRLLRSGTFWGVACALVLSPSTSNAASSQSTPASFSYEGVLKDSSNNPITVANAKVRLVVLPPAGSCALLRDEHTVDLSASNGFFSVGIGSASMAGGTLTGDPSNKLMQVFQNRYPINGNNGGSYCSYTPSSQDLRRVEVSVSVNGGSTWETFAGYHYINSVPNAQVADSVQGYGLSNIALALPTTSLPTCSPGAGTDKHVVFDTTVKRMKQCNASISTWEEAVDGGVVSVSASGGISASSTTGAVTLSLSGISAAEIANGAITPAKLANGSTAGNILRWNGASWAEVALSLPSNTILGISPGLGLSTSTASGVVTVSMIDNYLLRSGDTVSGSINVTGSSNATEVFIKQFAAQTADPILIQNSTGLEKFAIDKSGNIRVDAQAALTSDTSRFNVGVGPTGITTASGSDNTAIGWNALNSLTHGHRNVASGKESLKSNTTGFGNVASGYQALYGKTTGSTNVGIGYQAGYGNTSGNNNVFIGFQTGLTNTTGSGNVFIGDSAGYSETGSNKLYIENSSSASPLVYGDFAADSLKINGSLGVAGTLDMNSFRVRRVGYATSTDDATNRIYVDTMLAGHTLNGTPSAGMVPVYNATTLMWDYATPGGGSGDITDVLAGAGMVGGATSGSATLSISMSGVASSMIANSAITDAKISLNTISGDKLQNMGASSGLEVLQWDQAGSQWRAWNPHPVFVNITGDTMAGVLDMASNKVINLGYPTATGDAINRLYSDDVVANLGTQYVRKVGDTIAGNLMMGGKLGIGTTSPSEALHLVDPVNAPKILMESDTGAVVGPKIRLNHRGPGGIQYDLISTGSGDPGAIAGLFLIRDYNAGASRFVIDSSGNVGIGTTSPGAKFQVNGTGLFSSTVNMTSNRILAVGYPSATDDAVNKYYVDNVVVPNAVAKRVFVTSGTWNGNLGGISGADAKCQAAAVAASLSGTWKAIIADSTVPAANSRLGYQWIRLNKRVGGSWGNAVLISPTDINLWDGPNAPIDTDENGTTVSGVCAWTGSNASGTGVSANTCTNWTNGSSGNGNTGLTSSITTTWLSNNIQACTASCHLYCTDD